MILFNLIRNLLGSSITPSHIQQINLPSRYNKSISMLFKTRDGMLDEKSKKIVHDPSNDHLVEKELTNDESMFFNALADFAQKAELKGLFTIERNTNRDYVVYWDEKYSSCMVGKVNFYVEDDKFAVKKEGNSRASKIFNSLKMAEDYVSAKKGLYTIERREGEDRRYFEYIVAHKDIKDVTNKVITPKDVKTYIQSISYWIKYIKRLGKIDKTQKYFK